ncbi:MAG: PP2C family protein-serine/threonine phosphatase, partial [Sphaerospermopsis sp. SIO1G2]|nr:PP2C family protein-serine/threonine phosphatase [Sphaerospermopsis sp. SIO1G2]
PHEVLLTPGQKNHHLYFLLSGKIHIFLDEIDSINYFTTEAGDCIGEMSIIQERAVSAFVVAAERSQLLVIHETVFWEKMSTIPNIMRNMLSMLSERMRKQNNVTREIFEKQLRYELLQKEVTAAGKLQANIVPQDNPLFAEHSQVDVHAIMESAREVGGDFYDAFTVNQSHVCIAIGDVSGKGLPAALFMVRAITLLRMGLRKKKQFKTVMETVNRMLIKNNPDCNFVTLFVGLLNLKNGRLQYYNGGHNPPFISQNGRPYELLPLPRGVLLGFAAQARYEMAETTLAAGDMLLLYTDGITEAENGEQAFFGTERARQVLNLLGTQASATSVINTLHTAVADFVQDTPQSDDITMLALRYLGR